MNKLLVLLIFGSLPVDAQWGNCGSMSFASELCAGSSTSIIGVPISGATYYQWVLYNAVSGTYLSNYITASPSNTLFTSASQTGTTAWDVSALNSEGVKIGMCGGTVIIKSGAPKIPSIAWSGNLCIEQSRTYTCSSGATTYSWEVMEIAYTQTTSTNQLNLSGSIFSNSGLYTLRVKGNNSCGSSDWRTATIQVVSGCAPY
ncbi:MAG TPA: hypothetical protein PLM56_15315 [Cyclobacteriaceae bacterium]|jgi:hypothetical protein|nr:hypothetical protein [Cytophagales bacterium]HRE68710.1 hypothetical protein [Cyclobacteriaceae bacterium]HRF34873.1 hypothetical protein [Cyclobacteriaceae bacterium]